VLLEPELSVAEPQMMFSESLQTSMHRGCIKNTLLFGPLQYVAGLQSSLRTPTIQLSCHVTEAQLSVLASDWPQALHPVKLVTA
jgi:hypothetical protein